MKFMKLGSRPDTFYTAETGRSVSSEVPSDLVIQVKDSRYLLHKFPLLSKCMRLQRLCSEASDSSQHQILQLPDFPAGIEAFEFCAKFCYGITITVSAHNIIAARCAAEYLQMTEDVEKGNLISILEAFLNSCILQGWRDCITTLQSTKAFPLWAEDLGITSRCIEAIASKVWSHPSKVSLSYSHSRRARDDLLSNADGKERERNKPPNKNWWGEDIAELGIDLYWRTMIAIKSGGKTPSNLIGDALKIYASRWLPQISERGTMTHRPSTPDLSLDLDSDLSGEITSKDRLLLESIISLLPAERSSVSCRFLLKILKAANVLNASSSSKKELTRRVGFHLEEASVTDLLIPSLSDSKDTVYDVDLVMTIIEQFMSQGQSPPASPLRSKMRFERRKSSSAENIDLELQASRRSFTASHSSKIKVAKLLDGYLKEVAGDVNLPLSKFIALSKSVPEFARLDHDDLYRAIDIYLKAQKNLSKSERKKLCQILDCTKLSMEACMHAAQNELLPLRVVVQVLFSEQARATTMGSKVTKLPSNIEAFLATPGTDAFKSQASLNATSTILADDKSSASESKSPKSKVSTLRMKLAEEDELDEKDLCVIEKSSKSKAFCVLPLRPRKFFSRWWPGNLLSCGI